MKKFIRTALCAGAVTAALMGGALAASTEGYTTATDLQCTVTCDTAKGTYTAEYSQPGLAGQFVLLVVAGTEEDYIISDDTILYIDQAGASGGKVSFTGFIPKTVSDSVVLLGGSFGGSTRSPRVLGTIIGQGVQVSGAVTLEGRSSHAGATAALTAGSETFKATTNALGAWRLEGVPTGAGYQLEITMPGYLSYTKQNIDLEGDLTLPAVQLYGGDINGDDYINGRDLSTLLRRFGQTSDDDAFDPAVDINGDEYINGRDLRFVLINFGKMNGSEE